MRSEDWEYIYPSEDGEQLYRRQKRRNRRRRSIYLLILATLAAGSLWQSRHLAERTSLTRPAIGEGSREERMIFEWKGRQYETTIENRERHISEAECETMAAELIKVLPEIMLGDGQDAQEIREKLYLPERVEHYPFELTYFFSEGAPVLLSGEVKRDTRPQPFDLMVELRYGDWSKQWQWQGQVAAVEEGAQSARAEATALLQQAEQANRFETEFPLPQQMNGERLRWVEKLPSPWLILLWGGVIWLVYEVSLKERARRLCLQRQQELETAYPKLVERLLLYHQAGFLGWQVFERLALAGNDLPAALIVRIRLLSARINRGLPITEAYDEFARSCRSQPYRHLMQLLSDELQKGHRDLEQQLRTEIRRANRERLDAAAKAGERLGTRLLFPMVLLLVICMALVMIPFLVQL